MYEQASPLQADPSLLPFLRATDEAEQERLLAALISEQAGPLIRKIISKRSRFRAAGRAIAHDFDSDDIYGEVIVRLLKRVRESKANPGGEAISDFHGHVAVTTLNACHDYLRKKYPQRRGLENKLRYLLIRVPEFALWQSARGNWLCGLSAWKSEKLNPIEPKRIDRLREDPAALLPASVSGADARLMKDTLHAVFNWAGRPVDLSDLIAIISNLCDVKDIPVDYYDDQLFESVADQGLGSEPSYGKSCRWTTRPLPNCSEPHLGR